jgi:short-subunit dehydrogenase
MISTKVILITGASSGIGQVTAIELARRGHRVFGSSRKPAAAAAQGITMLPLDVTDSASVEAAVAQLVQQAGRIDVLINNAGAMLFGAAEEVTAAELQAHFDLNLFGVARMVQAVLPAMRAQGNGQIINLSSLGGLTGLPYLSAYSASKFALEGYSEALRLELLPFNIYVTLIEPGGARTESLDRSQQRAAQLLPAYNDGAGKTMARLRADQERSGVAPEQVAQAIAAIVAQPQPPLRKLVGSQAQSIATLKRLMPQRIYEALVSRQFRPS